MNHGNVQNIPGPGVVASLDKLVLAFSSGRLGTSIKILAGIVRWSWRACSVPIFLLAVPFLLIGLPYGIKVMFTSPDWTFGDVMVFVSLGLLVAGLALGWRWEWLGALLNTILLGIPTVIGLVRGEHDDELMVYVAWVLALLMCLSWALNTLVNARAGWLWRRLALVLAPLIAVAIGYCVSLMPGSKFNP